MKAFLSRKSYEIDFGQFMTSMNTLAQEAMVNMARTSQPPAAEYEHIKKMLFDKHGVGDGILGIDYDGSVDYQLWYVSVTTKP